eukprot:s1143_g2.t1
MFQPKNHHEPTTFLEDGPCRYCPERSLAMDEAAWQSRQLLEIESLSAIYFEEGDFRVDDVALGALRQAAEAEDVALVVCRVKLRLRWLEPEIDEANVAVGSMASCLLRIAEDDILCGRLQDTAQQLGEKGEDARILEQIAPRIKRGNRKNTDFAKNGVGTAGQIVFNGKGLRSDLQELHSPQECRSGLGVLLSSRERGTILTQPRRPVPTQALNVSYIPPIEQRTGRLEPSGMEAAGCRSLTRRFQKRRLENYRHEIMESIRRCEPNAGRR